MDDRAAFKGLDRSLRKQRIIDTAVEVFHRKGYRASSLDDVAGELGVTRAALYHYFSSKEKLLSAIYLQALESFFAGAYRIGESDAPPREKLRAFVDHTVRHVIIDNLSMFSVFFSEEGELPEAEAKLIREEKRKYTGVVEKILREGIERGSFRPMDPRLGAFAILGMCNWIYKWYRPGEQEGGEAAIVECFLSLMEHGLLPGADASSEQSAVRLEEAARRVRDQGEALLALAKTLEDEG